jgi:hypothetical protein
MPRLVRAPRSTSVQFRAEVVDSTRDRVDNLEMAATTGGDSEAVQRPLTLRHHSGHEMMTASGQIPMAANTAQARPADRLGRPSTSRLRTEIRHVTMSRSSRRRPGELRGAGHRTSRRPPVLRT